MDRIDKFVKLVFGNSFKSIMTGLENGDGDYGRNINFSRMYLLNRTCEYCKNTDKKPVDQINIYSAHFATDLYRCLCDKCVVANDDMKWNKYK